MKQRLLISGLLIICCLGMLFVWEQTHARLEALRAENARLIQKLNSQDQSVIPAVADAPHEPNQVSADILRLRNEVSRLSARRRELSSVKAENDRLRAQAASASPTRFEAIPGYMRKSEAQNVGYGSPENTLQTLLWSVQKRDLAAMLEAFTPEVAKQLRSKVLSEDDNGEKFLSQAQGLVGMGILRREAIREAIGTDAIEVDVQVSPDIPPSTVRLQLVNGQWKIATPL